LETNKNIAFLGLVFLCFCLPYFGLAQNDSIPNLTEEETVFIEGEIQKIKNVKPHSPRKAALLSAVLPGAGQVYNKKYWKVPIVAVAFGTAIFFINDNTRQMNIYMEERLFRLENPGQQREFPNASDEALRRATQYHRRYRDVSYASIALIWAINIIDANIDAYMIKFDVSEDLSLTIRPHFDIAPQQHFGLGFNLKL
jgi:hypothetical protein